MQSLGGWALLGLFAYFIFLFRSVFQFGSPRPEVDIHQTARETLLILILVLGLFVASALLEPGEGTVNGNSLGRPIAACAGALAGYGLVWFFTGKPPDRETSRIVAGGPRRRRMEEIMLRGSVWNKATLPMVVGGAVLALFGCGLLARSDGGWRTTVAFAFIIGGAAIAISAFMLSGRPFRGKFDRVYEEFPELKNVNVDDLEKEFERETGKSARPSRTLHALLTTRVFPVKEKKPPDSRKE